MPMIWHAVFTPSPRAAGVRPRPRGFGGDLRAGQHARDFLAAVVGGERVDAGGDALALVERVL